MHRGPHDLGMGEVLSETLRTLRKLSDLQGLTYTSSILLAQRNRQWIDAMYEDKLDGRIGNDFFDSKAAEMRAAEAGIMCDMESHQASNSWN